MANSADTSLSAELLNNLSTKYVDLFYLVSVMMAILQQKERLYLALFFVR